MTGVHLLSVIQHVKIVHPVKCLLEYLQAAASAWHTGLITTDRLLMSTTQCPLPHQHLHENPLFQDSQGKHIRKASMASPKVGESPSEEVERMLSSSAASVLTTVVRNRQSRMTLESSVATKGYGSLCLYASSAWPQSTVQWLQGMIQVKFAELRLLMLARASKAAN
ncbi:MAG: hypothetical protein Q9215_006810 [Flavoplaca cf. flavocitrina]